MKLGVANGCYCSETEQFAYFKECGFDASLFSLGKYFDRKGMFDAFTVSDQQIEEHFTMLKEEAEKVDFFIDQTHSAFSGHPRGYDFDIDEIVKRQEASIKATHYLGSKFCVVHPIIKPGRRYDLLKKEAFDESVEFYKRLTPTLEKFDVYCCIENMWVSDPVHRHICSTILSHAEEMREMSEVLGERFKICLDVGHAPLTQDDPVKMVNICGDKLACLHAHEVDGLSDLHTFPFCKFGKPVGIKPMRTDWQGFMKALKEENYQGNLSFEIGVPGPRELHKAGLEYLSEVGRYLINVYDNHNAEEA